MQKDFDTILNRTFVYAKTIAKQFYFEWAANPQGCPAFDGEIVHITREGWDHIRHLRKRTKTDVMGRLFVLERAKKLLKETTLFQQHVVGTHKKQKVEYWIFEGIIVGISVKVIVRSIQNKPKHLLSVIKKGTIAHEL
ncbi:MAG: hypothetical protein A2249_00855 [Candidatus Jacksonbacteria bacterium RIFOXYA2_FULL_44_7]|uniref:Uncharacterized protein n=1 Tax=Candidatus Jacksonbacteria bacterium RIFCSPLOWO2_02_FULL_44_20 TaxID=1798460 RepID=A0A1G2A9J8_9BACT|nr:MAG: hypothetical protein UW39_C0011G0003 [Parcubacteria group bacterium GW2011_GWC2_44_17]OGY70777.1 MAG: hypothetical protein A3E05_01065 [Candidatus Jacksonbacteria bacterium RIFCSPHIGHO2_12_FULL_44_12]OGY71120.1 MAG: hypothetical protein A3C00_03480 [Candidatus Jacksonbacteria bacterium RIFCSPHIGHO2_02_FULL_44_25]OGY72720.1 MAG: hypothetical protein A3H61_05050 [Candidatus Jacksonbacteria bacterium RIFCSPLOWO2_02_FULL_44_20]OGY74352.1 MAG: hypothetical protein A3H07_03195 [Candidatus Jac